MIIQPLQICSLHRSSAYKSYKSINWGTGRQISILQLCYSKKTTMRRGRHVHWHMLNSDASTQRQMTPNIKAWKLRYFASSPLFMPRRHSVTEYLCTSWHLMSARPCPCLLYWYWLTSGSHTLNKKSNENKARQQQWMLYLFNFNLSCLSVLTELELMSVNKPLMTPCVQMHWLSGDCVREQAVVVLVPHCF